MNMAAGDPQDAGSIEQSPFEDVKAPYQNTSGSGQSGGIPGSEDILVNMGMGGQPNNHILLIQGSEEPKEFLARGRLSKQEIADVMLMIADYTAVYNGHTDIMSLIAWKFNASVGIDGQGRKEFVQVETSGRMAQLRGWAGRQADRFRNSGAPNAPPPVTG